MPIGMLFRGGFLFLVIACYLMCSYAYGEESFYLGVLNESISENNDIGDSHVVELGGRLSIANNLSLSGSYMWLDLNGRTFEGINFSLNAETEGLVKLYIGAGVFAGFHDVCEDETIESSTGNGRTFEDEYCYIDDSTIGVYPEAGLQLSLGQLIVGSYARYYKTFNTGKNEFYMTGVFFGVRF